MQPWKERVVEEKQELDQKLTKRQAFITGSDFGKLDSSNQYWLKEQWKAMENCSYSLHQRINLFE